MSIRFICSLGLLCIVFSCFLLNVCTHCCQLYPQGGIVRSWCLYKGDCPSLLRTVPAWLLKVLCIGRPLKPHKPGRLVLLGMLGMCMLIFSGYCQRVFQNSCTNSHSQKLLFHILTSTCVYLSFSFYPFCMICNGICLSFLWMMDLNVFGMQAGNSALLFVTFLFQTPTHFLFDSASLILICWLYMLQITYPIPCLVFLFA